MLLFDLDTVDTLGIFGGVGRVVAVDMSTKLRIIEIAKATGLSKSTLIRYEEEGKLPRSKRDGRKWRYYTEDDRNRIVEILKNLQLI